MKRSAKSDPLAERPNLDFSKGVRGKYYNLIAEGSNLVLLDADLMDSFPDSPSVNRALRAFLAINAEVRSVATRQSARTKAAPSPKPPAFDPRVGLRPKASTKRRAA